MSYGVQKNVHMEFGFGQSFQGEVVAPSWLRVTCWKVGGDGCQNFVLVLVLTKNFEPPFSCAIEQTSLPQRYLLLSCYATTKFRIHVQLRRLRWTWLAPFTLRFACNCRDRMQFHQTHASNHVFTVVLSTVNWFRQFVLIKKNCHL